MENYDIDADFKDADNLPFSNNSLLACDTMD